MAEVEEEEESDGRRTGSQEATPRCGSVFREESLAAPPPLHLSLLRALSLPLCLSPWRLGSLFCSSVLTKKRSQQLVCYCRSIPRAFCGADLSGVQWSWSRKKVFQWRRFVCVCVLFVGFVFLVVLLCEDVQRVQLDRTALSGCLNSLWFV